MPLDETGLVHGGGDLDNRVEAAILAHDVHHRLASHAVLHANDEAGRSDMRLDELAGPARVVGLHQDEDGIERLDQGRNITEMKRPHRRNHQLAADLDANPVLPDRLHVGGPLIDEGDIQPGPSDIGTDAGAIGARAEDGNFHVLGIGWGRHAFRSGDWSLRGVKLVRPPIDRFNRRNDRRFPCPFAGWISVD